MGVSHRSGQAGKRGNKTAHSPSAIFAATAQSVAASTSTTKLFFSCVGWIPCDWVVR
jgi:hypothetical protein